MSEKLDSLMVDAGQTYTYTRDYQLYMESHMRFLRNHESTTAVGVDKEQVYKHLYDFTGFLRTVGIPPEDHWLILRMNGFTSLDQLDDQVESLLIPSQQLVESLKRMYRTSTGKV